jgi:hypothetical protein
MSPPEIPTEPDRLSGRMFAALFAFTVIAIVVSGVVVWMLAGREVNGGGELGPHAPLPAEIDAVTTEPFERGLTAERVRAQQLEALDRWQWVDRAHTRVRLPFAAARDQYLASQPKPGGTP